MIFKINKKMKILKRYAVNYLKYLYPHASGDGFGDGCTFFFCFTVYFSTCRYYLKNDVDTWLVFAFWKDGDRSLIYLLLQCIK